MEHDNAEQASVEGGTELYESEQERTEPAIVDTENLFENMEDDVAEPDEEFVSAANDDTVAQEPSQRAKKKQRTKISVIADGRVPFVASMKFKVAMMVILAVALTAGLMLLIMVPISRTALREETKHYMYDVAISNGTALEQFIEAGDLSNKVAMKNTFGNVRLQGMDTSYAYIVGGDGTMLCHPVDEKVGQPVENAVVLGVVDDIRKGKRDEPQVVEYEYKGEKKYAAYYVTKMEPTILVVTTDEAEIMAPIQKVIRTSIIAFVVIVIVFGILAMIITGILTKPIILVSDLVTKMSHMDFTDRAEDARLLRRKDETGVMSRAVATMRKEMTLMIRDIQQQSDSLFSASEQLDEDASHTAHTVAKVENAVGDIASGATSQADETQTATENVITMGNMIEQTNAVAESLQQNSEQMRTSSDQAMAILKELMQVNEQTKASIDEIYEQTNITNASAQKIKDATDIIAAIAEETNLLSLNASIEAARAGEQGRGFAVVASQIQKLAEQSTDSAMQIDDITNILMQDSTHAVETMQEVQEIMAIQSEKMIQTEARFKEVYDGVENALGSVTAITGRTENLDESRSKVVDVVQNLSAIAEQNAASSQETSASVMEVSDILDNISNNAAGLKDIAYQLDQSVRKIRL
ncbi:MAG: methyl-accepting chemotaxis protein [Lachnospiraceae bacterium]|nr:methyl-accepting chemotaxis protein [Lachnospiraceae bacterium]